MKLVLIESPGKRQKWQKSLGSGYRVMASMGHVVELAKDGEDALGFDLSGDRVTCRFVPRGDRGKKVLTELKQAVKSATEVIFATDPDREGEVISWHLARELKVKNPRRVVTSEITETAIKKAVSKPRPLDQNLVDAALLRTCLDKLVGFRGSPLVWSLKNGAKSVGRVQSATLHLLCDRERAITAFVPEDYWSVYVDYAEGFRAFYAGQVNRSDEPEVEETDDSESPDSKKAAEGTRVTTQTQADQLVAMAKSHPHQVVSTQGKVSFKKPPAAFTTSSLQQAAGTRLKLNPEKTMQVAQKLYEQGYITYMRTDSPTLSEEFCASVRKYLEQNDPENVPQKTTVRKSAALSQEAHEAIRPTEITRLPSVIKAELTPEEAGLYDLIWRRAIASLCQPARLLKTKIVTKSGSVTWQALGQVLQFEGYLRYWRDIGSDQVLPTLKEGQPLTCTHADADKKQTMPPPRYSESKLIQVMEKQGIGRPSTYAPTVKTLKEREYVVLKKGLLVPTQLGMEVDEFLGRVLPELIQADFTAKMERELDAIAHGKLDWQKYLTSWNRDYFAPALKKAGAKIPVSMPTVTNPSRVKVTPPVCEPPDTRTDTSTETRSELTNIRCPRCKHPMTRVYSKSKKLQTDHFLSCDERNNGCGAVMFFNVSTLEYELPDAKRKNPPRSDKPSQHSCPICGSSLERYKYTKNGQDKVMLRCSNPKTKQNKCKEVAFFESKKGNWWSPKFGELGAE
ncbi:type I DNA topoisomerase [Coleofasciculus sp. FACHB-129]|uniref:type I DNA topoisomerase n=1 Tax=Cyanophyceae TaxID=3028117 RepID=UPI00168201CA|nr:type I DNA topoisomerase [Coleofasciculus sp. FACHB-129]MBD1896956.1 type I DNA topoisomerase [Coleofasciculus sp. FACHB-129]